MTVVSDAATSISCLTSPLEGEKRAYDADCRRCPRLANFLDEVRTKYPNYWARPVPSFGDDHARFLIVGLAPGLHGANATGRPFTGDWCGPLLYSTLHKHGFATKPISTHRDDGLALVDCRIAACLIVARHASRTSSQPGLCHDVLPSSMSIALTSFPATVVQGAQ